MPNRLCFDTKTNVVGENVLDHPEGMAIDWQQGACRYEQRALP